VGQPQCFALSTGVSLRAARKSCGDQTMTQSKTNVKTFVELNDQRLSGDYIN
jgi:hypothetical protein